MTDEKLAVSSLPSEAQWQHSSRVVDAKPMSKTQSALQTIMATMENHPLQIATDLADSTPHFLRYRASRKQCIGFSGRGPFNGSDQRAY